jgi:hypothetical protein
MTHLRVPCLCIGLLALGCSSDPEPAQPGSGADAAASDASEDATHETYVEETSPSDVPTDTTIAVCPQGSWGTVPNTQCGIIDQDCDNPLLTCYPSLFGGSPGTSCTFIGYGAKTRGAICESNAECATGLVCLAGNCTPFCCKEFQYEICGPGGQCNINFNIGSGYHVLICGYSEPCTLWAHDCPKDEACHPVSSDGSAACSPPASGSFVGEGNPCSARNDCGDSQGCISHAGAPNVCRFHCKLGVSPYDAGAPNAGPGDGGCPVGQSCEEFGDGPDWLGVCLPDV